ncbi:hypothetical protein MJO29_003769 [Puccinia striiformis f. sp. tritici]|nr:hypothetical protein MJO29_003769 [Puccinia striiformis f. sp. tritici]
MHVIRGLPAIVQRGKRANAKLAGNSIKKTKPMEKTKKTSAKKKLLSGTDYTIRILPVYPLYKGMKKTGLKS